jgi:hypothetical protein
MVAATEKDDGEWETLGKIEFKGWLEALTNIATAIPRPFAQAPQPRFYTR